MAILCRNCGNDIPENMDVIPGDTSKCRVCGHIEILTPKCNYCGEREQYPGRNGLCAICHDELANETETTTISALIAIGELNLTHEGVGGRKNWGDGVYYPGTGLRAPGMPFHDTRWNSRLKMLKNLEDRGYLANVRGTNKTGFSFTITECGKERVAKLQAEGWGVYDMKTQLNPEERYPIYSRGVRKNPVTDSPGGMGVFPKTFYTRVVIKKPETANGGVA